MPEEASLELTTQNPPKSINKMVIFLVVGVLLLAGIAVAVLFFIGDNAKATANSPATDIGAATVVSDVVKGKANYVGMPRPFLFNLAGANRSRLVEIKVQLMVRGDDGVTAKMHIPLIEHALLNTFSAADVQKLSTQAGKDELRQLALLNVQNTLQPITGQKVVEKVLFTGFVMQ
ncbi:flagellar basal body-associated protein FliL [Shewanella sp. UCD-KL21]|uniref:flagellar basal body-associated protein FliL n=1 Tax=Shewanella sp. UCD-KL21 TaxID=1917164 RepID=UPI000970F1A7|nr:flagellar basal body-associated protein FliL [Shewanella sp. UCD-KL21]